MNQSESFKLRQKEDTTNKVIDKNTSKQKAQLQTKTASFQKSM